MIEITAVVFVLAFIGFGFFKEYRNPLWAEIVEQGVPYSDSAEGKPSVQMVFFWKSAETYSGAEHADYYNAMDVYLCTEGVLFKCPPFMARKTVLLPWSKVQEGTSFNKFMVRRKALNIKGTELYISVTRSITKKPGWAI